jgi:hypothetical protein
VLKNKIQVEIQVRQKVAVQIRVAKNQNLGLKVEKIAQVAM